MATLLTAPDFGGSDNPTITYSNPDGENVTRLQACIELYLENGMETVVEYRDIPKTGTSYTFELTDAERNAFHHWCQDERANACFRLKTVINGKTSFSYLNRIYTSSPIITATVVDVNDNTIALTGNPNVLIKEWSVVQASMTAKAREGRAIDESLYVIRNGSNSVYDDSCTLEYPESNEFIFIAVDSLGLPSVAKVYTPMVDYVRLYCKMVESRPDALGNMTVACKGNSFNGSFGAVENTIRVQCRYAVTGGAYSDWIDMNYSTSGNAFYASANITIEDFNQNLSYSFEARVTDKLDSYTAEMQGVASLPIFHWGKNDFVFEVPVDIKGDLRLKGEGNYGTTLRFGDGDYCYISEPEDDKMLVEARQIDFVADNIYINDNPMPFLAQGVWTPELSASAISYYTTQQGWYSKMGQIVSVGFYVKAYCKSGYQNADIQISGLPFQPLYSAAGGGMCSGAYVSAAFNFQCYVAETSGFITTRVQSCNNASAENLSTSASGCRYRSGEGEITLSGTITYIANS